MWPTKLWNLEVMVAVLSVVMVMDKDMTRPLTSRLHFIEELLHIPQGEKMPKKSENMVALYVLQ